MLASIFHPVALAALVLAVASTSRSQTPDALAADLEKDWAAQKARMVALADAMPPDKYGFKATPPQRAYGEQLLHLAESHVTMFKSLDPAGKVPVPALTKEHGKAEVMKSLADAYDYGLAVLRAEPGGLLSRPASGNAATRARTVWGAMNNAMNHYGQCVVYLRLNDIVPPASRR